MCVKREYIMNVKSLLLFSASVISALSSKAQNNTVAVLTASYNNQDTNIAMTEVAQQINCKATKEIVMMIDLHLSDSDWAKYVMPSVIKLVRSFEVSASAARFEIFSRSATAYNGYWCINVALYSSANANINSLVSTIQAKPCNVLSPIGISTIRGTLYGSRRPNTPVEILWLTDWRLNNSGMRLFDIDSVKSIGGVRFVCAGVGPGIDYQYLGLICGNNIIKIANYGAVINSIDPIANNLCNGINTPTVKPSPLLTFSPTKAPRITKTPTKYPTKRRKTKYPTLA